MKGLGESIVDFVAGKPRPGAPAYLDQLLKKLREYYLQGKAFVSSAAGTAAKSYQTGKEVTTRRGLGEKVKEGWRQQNILKGLLDEKTRKKLGFGEPPSR